MNRGAWTRVENLDLSTTSVGGLYRFLGGVNQLDRGFEGLDRALQSIATRVSQYNIEPTGENPPDCFQASKFKLDGWESTPCRNRRRPVRWGTADGLPRTAESWVARLKSPRWTSEAWTRPVLVWRLVEFFNYRLRDKLYSIGYFRKQRAVGFREPDLKIVLIVCNTLDAKLSRI
jgi:hypothetical protein